MLRVVCARTARPVVRQSWRSFARQRGGVPTATGPPPPAPVPEDPWQHVRDPQSGQMYWWNTQTNETTPLGAAKPAALQQQQQAQPATQQQGGGLMSTMAEGMAFGFGSAIARQAVGSMFGSWGGGGSSEEPPQEMMPPPEQQDSNYEWGGGWSNNDDDGDDWA